MFHLHVVPETKIHLHLVVNPQPVLAILFQPLNQLLIKHQHISLQIILKQVLDLQLILELFNITVIYQVNINALGIFPEFLPYGKLVTVRQLDQRWG